MPIKALSGLLLLILLSACKITIVVPAGGKVTSTDGVVCLAGSTCTIEVEDETFDDTFKAVPDPGYVFKQWKKGKDHLCAKGKSTCRLFTTLFNGNQILLDILNSDKEFFLKPVFVNKSGYKVSYWKTALAENAQGNFATNSFLYDVVPNVQQCDPGVLSEAAAKRALKALNQIRAMHKLPAVQYSNSFSSQVQQAALVQTANNYLTHTPAQGDTCFTQAALDGASSSNIGAGAPSDPIADVVGWTNDNNNLAALEEAGHRRWMLFPELGFTSYGQVNGSTALKVFNFNMTPQNSINPGVEFIAFPYKSYPWTLVTNTGNVTPWSLSMVPSSANNSPFNYFSNAEVVVKDVDAGKNLDVHTVHNDTKRFGISNFLSWHVDNWDYDTKYKVTVKNIRMPTGGTRNVSYSVLLDRFNLVDLTRPLEAGDSASGSTISGNFDNAKDEDSYTANLSGSVSFTGSSKFSSQGFFIRLYDDRKRLIRSSDSGFNMNLSDGTYTILVSPCDESGLCFIYNETIAYQVNYQ